MKNVSLLIFFLLKISCSLAQESTLYETRFEKPDAAWLWSDVNDENMYRKIGNGGMTIDHKGKNIFWTLKQANLGDQQMVFETTVTNEQSATNSGIGIILKTQQDLYYYFIIYPSEKTYWVGSEQKGNWKTFHGKDDNHPQHPAVKGLNENQELRVILAEEHITFFVNGTAVFDALRHTRFEELDGIADYGIVTTAVQKSTVTSFLVKQLPKTQKKTSALQNLTTVYDTDFNSTDSSWLYSAANDENMLRKIEDGQLKIEHKGKHYYWTIRNFYVESEDFDIDLTGNVMEANGDHSFGIVLTTDHDAQYYLG
ncbi:MAG: hypothetical protein H7Y04_00765, partial [Verrucomicrobia bacterium]|nr:hypothetical protein [Cytophagales bacterium]